MNRTKIFRWIIALITLGIVIIGVWFYHFVLLYVLIAFIVAYLLYPIVNFGAKYRIPRVISILLVYALFIFLIVILINVIIPQIKQQAEETYKLVQGFQAEIHQNEAEDGSIDMDSALKSIGLEKLSVYMKIIEEKFTFIEIDKYFKNFLTN